MKSAFSSEQDLINYINEIGSTNELLDNVYINSKNHHDKGIKILNKYHIFNRKLLTKRLNSQLQDMLNKQEYSNLAYFASVMAKINDMPKTSDNKYIYFYMNQPETLTGTTVLKALMEITNTPKVSEAVNK